MKNFNIKEFKSYLRAENVNKDTIEQVSAYLEDFITYGKRKPYMSINEFNTQIDSAINLLEKQDFSNKFTYLVKLTSKKHYSWKNIKYKLTNLFDSLTYKGKLPQFNYYIWAYAKSDIDFEIYFLVVFSEKICIDSIQNEISDMWYTTDECYVTAVQETNEIVRSLSNIKLKVQEHVENGFTPYLKSSKIFLQGEMVPYEADEDSEEFEVNDEQDSPF